MNKMRILLKLRQKFAVKKEQEAKRVIRIASVFLLVCLVIWTLWGNTAIEINEYEIMSDTIPEAFTGFRIAQISDLHNAEFGENNCELVAMLTQADPDIIVITGDLIDANRTDIKIALEFARQTMKIAPVYYVTGNHEAWVSAYDELKTGLLDSGVTVLENQKVTITREGEYITLIGLDDPAFQGGSIRSVSDLQNVSDGYTVLLAHRPELFDEYVNAHVNLVFSGHAHGGQFRLPFIGGLVAPDQGLFPKYDAGAFTENGTTMIVSRGIGNSVIPLRFNNRPEIVLVTLERSYSANA